MYVEREGVEFEGDDGVHIKESMKSSGRGDSITLVLQLKMALERCWQGGCVCYRMYNRWRMWAAVHYLLIVRNEERLNSLL